MNKDEINEHRRTRLKALLDERYGGSQAELGKALGLVNGAFVRQLLTKHRPISEKTVARIEALPGLAGWFGLPVQTESGETLVLTDEERDIIIGLRAAKAARAGGAKVVPLPVERRVTGSRKISNPGQSGTPQRRSTDRKKEGA